MQFKQSTVQEIIDSEREMILTASERFGQHYESAFSSSMLLSQFVKSLRSDLFIFGVFLSQVKKHHTLALFSAVRLHSVQSMMNLRQVLEAGACAAYAISNHDPKDFVDVDKRGLLDPLKKLTKKRYNWLQQNYQASADAINDVKNQINTSNAHANLLNTYGNFRHDDGACEFLAPFFDFEDDFYVKKDLFVISDVAIILLDLFDGVNSKLNIVKFIDGFNARFDQLVREHEVLRQEMMSTERYKQAMMKAKALKGRSANSPHSGSPLPRRSYLRT